MRAAIVYVSVVLLCASGAFGGVISYLPITNDADSGISLTKVYTHTLDLGVGDGGAIVNGVHFTRVDTANVDAIPNFAYTVYTGGRYANPHYIGYNVSGDVEKLFGDFMFNGNNAPGGVATLTLSGLSVGTTYDTRIYTRAAGGPRVAQIDFENDGAPGADDSVTLDQGDALANPPGLDTINRAYALSYQFTAQSDQLTVSFTQAVFNWSWHQYGVTNEVVGVERITTLFNTGVDENGLVLAPGTPDPHYELVGTRPATVAKNHPNYIGNDPVAAEGSSWIGPVADLHADVAPGNYVYATSFDLSGLDPDSAEVSIRVAVDNILQDVLLNGASTGIGVADGGFGGLSEPLVLDSGFQPGINTLEFVAVNNDGGPNPHGFRAELSGTASVPEPSTFVLALAGLFVLVLLGRRKPAA
ncbi:MAG: PEP-CTERM sorting domain-containing protein [Candidatus Nealsonbacteria bacterium]|nr:PEP-CTERM sorting domain-containing protein [Candidatus Nealsonbacteria bacterium]